MNKRKCINTYGLHYIVLKMTVKSNDNVAIPPRPCM